MISEQVRNKIKLIKIHTRRLMQSSLTGDYTSAFKGSGLEFDQLREYQYGDDVRFIDWNSSAKVNKIMIKQLIEERDRTIILAIDVSMSTRYSSQYELRQDVIAQLAATLAFVAGNNKDKVGALFFSDRIEKWISPSRGPSHMGRILESIFTINPTGKTNIADTLRFLINMKKRNAIVFFISDWLDDLEQYNNLLKAANCLYDLVGIRILDPCEKVFPDVGLLEIEDPESGKRYVLDTKKTKPGNIFLQTRALEQKKLFEKFNADLLDITIGQSFINPLISFFHKRIRRQI